MFPAGNIECFEGLVGKIGGVSHVDIAVVGDGGKEHIGHLPVIGPGADGRDDAALGAFGIAHLDKLAEPAF